MAAAATSDASWRGPLEVVGAAALFSVMSVLVKLAGETLPAPMMVLARAVVTLVISIAWLWQIDVDWRGHRRGLLLLRGLFGFTGLCCFFFAITRLPLAEVTVIHYLNPVLTAGLAAAVLGERVGGRLVVAMALSLVGVVSRPTFLFGDAVSLDGWGVAAAFGGAVASAAAYTTVRKLRETEHPLVIVMWFSMIAVPASLPLVAPVFVWPQGREWLLLLGIGVVTQAAQVLLTRGLIAVPAGRAMTISYVQILFAAAWGVLLFGERLRIGLAVGGLLIFIGTVLVVLQRQRVANPT
jgi:drug/metabolite transporter (DMT)-like permease